MLEKSESELKLIFLKNTGVDVYNVNLTAESDEGESSRSIVEFVVLDVISSARCIDKCYRL